MVDTFPAPRLKISRAKSHIAELEETLQAHKKSDWCKASLERLTNPAPGQPDYKLNVEFKGAPAIVSAQVGDAIHNLRSALDLLAVRLVELNGGNTKDVMFPFAKDAAALPQLMQARHLDRAGAADQATILALQPYHGGNAALRGLHDMDIQDKHHALIPVANFVTTPEIRMKTDAAGKPLGFDEGKLEPELVAGSEGRIDFVFPNESPFVGKPLVSTLNELVELVTDIVDKFEALPRP